ncbi:hypothetical protein D9611_001042 [Ephemerocybe angulata]|uniref:Uncharacterized protein n=1 Tax=Ephemerocybe angulata TaxID=980116 RepID=A0A8H5F7C8_9AGAR|nr:hypothetical protein D9611_001042 [Tulosesus angulatus]
MTCTITSRAPWTRILKQSSPHLHRKFHARPGPTRTRDLFLTQCLNLLHRQTHDDLWAVLNVLGRCHDSPRAVTQGLTAAGVPSTLHPRVLAIRGAAHVAPVHTTDYDAGNVLGDGTDTLPTWVYILHLTKRCQTPADSMDILLDPLLAHLPQLPPHEQAPLLIFAAAHFATYNLVLPLQRVVDEFLALPHPIRTPNTPGSEESRILTLGRNTPYETYFNLFLRALACSTKSSSPYSNYVTTTIKHLTSLSPNNNENNQKYTLHPATYTALLTSTHNSLLRHESPLQSHLLTPYLAQFLLQHMRRDNDALTSNTTLKGHLPSMQHLEALIRFWGKEAVGPGTMKTRRTHTAKAKVDALWTELQTLSTVRREQGLDPPAPPASAHADHVLRANTLYLGAQSSVERVKELLGAFSLASASANKNSGSGEGEGEGTVGAGAAAYYSDGEAMHIRTKPQLDAYDLTATLHAAASDPNVTAQRLREMFTKLRVAYRTAPTRASTHENSKNNGDEKELVKQGEVPLAAHTVFLRGLLIRKKWAEARNWWDREVVRALKRGEVGMDRMALTVGAQVLVRAGRPREAFELVERWAWRPGMEVDADSTLPEGRLRVDDEKAREAQGRLMAPEMSTTAEHSSALTTTPTLDIEHKKNDRNTPTTPTPTQPVHLTSISLNELLVSFKRTQRPDVVFRLWDHMYALYGVLHTPESLNILLQAARMAAIMDGRSVRTQVGYLWEAGKARLRLRGSGKGIGKGNVEGADGGRRREVGNSSEEGREVGVKEVREIIGEDAGKGGEGAITTGGVYKGGLWRGMRPEDAARDVFLKVLFGMELGMRSSSSSEVSLEDTGSSDTGNKRVMPQSRLAEMRAPACAVRRDWDSDAGVVGLGVGFPSLGLRRYEYKPSEDMYDWVPVLSTTSPQDASSHLSPPTAHPHPHAPMRVPRLIHAPRPHYPHLALTNQNFLQYLSLLAVTQRTGEVALVLAWMKGVGVVPSESTLALALVLWEEVSVEGPLVEIVVARGRRWGRGDPRARTGASEGGGGEEGIERGEEGRKEGGEGERRGEPRDEYERLVWWIEDWVGAWRVPGPEVLMKWRGIVKRMREAGGPGSVGDQDL